MNRIVAFTVVVLAAAPGCTVYQGTERVELRTPGSSGDAYIRHQFEVCQKTTNPDACALQKRIVI